MKKTVKNIDSNLENGSNTFKTLEWPWSSFEICYLNLVLSGNVSSVTLRQSSGFQAFYGSKFLITLVL